LRAHIYQNGPVAIALDAGLLQWYFGGIVDPFFPNLECDPNSLDHALLIVGWGQEPNWIDRMTPYVTSKILFFILR
jgi:cathepsin F